VYLDVILFAGRFLKNAHVQNRQIPLYGSAFEVLRKRCLRLSMQRKTNHCLLGVVAIKEGTR
jgi:hypothetical protein